MTMETWSAGLFLIVFVSQIFLISWYYPEKLLSRMKYVMDHYPRETYPRLYPRDVHYYKSGQARFRWINRFMIAIGFLFLASAIYVDGGTFAHDGYISEMWPVVYGMFQFLPLMMLELSEFSQHKLMREAMLKTRRTAELKPRRLFDFVPPVLFFLAVILYIGVNGFALVINDYEWQWSTFITTTSMNVMFIGLGAWSLRGKRTNPHIATEDRSRLISTALCSYLYVSIAVSLFFVFVAADGVYDLDYLDAILMSVYFQAISFLSIGTMIRGVRLEELDFEVYRDDASAAEAT